LVGISSKSDSLEWVSSLERTCLSFAHLLILIQVPDSVLAPPLF
jgi:hypothetical protein